MLIESHDVLISKYLLSDNTLNKLKMKISIDQCKQFIENFKTIIKIDNFKPLKNLTSLTLLIIYYICVNLEN
jgi:hypothetical protein